MNNANNAEEYLSTYFHLGNDLDCGFQHYLSINAKQPSSNTDTCCLDANILPNIIKETDLILNVSYYTLKYWSLSLSCFKIIYSIFPLNNFMQKF